MGIDGSMATGSRQAVRGLCRFQRRGEAMRTSSASWLRRSDLAYGLSFSIAPKFFSGFFFSGRCVRVRVCRSEQLQSTLC